MNLKRLFPQATALLVLLLTGYFLVPWLFADELPSDRTKPRTLLPAEMSAEVVAQIPWNQKTGIPYQWRGISEWRKYDVFREHLQAKNKVRMKRQNKELIVLVETGTDAVFFLFGEDWKLKRRYYLPKNKQCAPISDFALYGDHLATLLDLYPIQSECTGLNAGELNTPENMRILKERGWKFPAYDPDSLGIFSWWNGIKLWDEDGQQVGKPILLDGRSDQLLNYQDKLLVNLLKSNFDWTPVLVDSLGNQTTLPELRSTFGAFTLFLTGDSLRAIRWGRWAGMAQNWIYSPTNNQWSEDSLDTWQWSFWGPNTITRDGQGAFLSFGQIYEGGIIEPGHYLPHNRGVIPGKNKVFTRLRFEWNESPYEGVFCSVRGKPFFPIHVFQEEHFSPLFATKLVDYDEGISHHMDWEQDSALTSHSEYWAYSSSLHRGRIRKANDQQTDLEGSYMLDQYYWCQLHDGSFAIPVVNSEGLSIIRLHNHPGKVHGFL